MVNTDMKAVLFPVIAGGCLALSASENLLPNADFRLGTAGYAVTRSVDRNHSWIPGNPEVRLLPDGKNGRILRVSTNGNDMASVFTTCVKLDKNTGYELSFLVRTDTPPVSIQVSPYVKIGLNIGSVGMKKIRLNDTHPVRFVFSYRTGDSAFPLHGWKISRMIDLNGVKKTFDLSELQLNRQDSGEPVVPKMREAALSGEKFRLAPGETMPLKLNVLNRGARAVREQYRIQVTDLLTGKRAAETVGTLECKPGVTEVLWTPPPLPNGLMKAEGTVGKNACIAPFKFSVSPQTFTKEGELPIDIGVDSLLRFRRDLYYNDRRQESEEMRAESTLDDDMRFLAGTGASSLRLWFEWRRLEPENGVFRWEETDRIVDAAVRNGIRCMPIFGTEFFTYRDKKESDERLRLPQWLVEKSKIQDCAMPHFTAAGRKTALPPVDLWERMIAAVVSRYKGRIETYEILNEPNLYLTPAELMVYLKSAYRTIKKIDPSCRVVGACVTGDFNAHILEYGRALMGLGAAKYCDVISFHPYNNLFEDSRAPGDAMIFELKKTMAESGGENRPLWNTELYYLNPHSEGGNDAENGPVYHPGYLVRRYLLDAACGIQRIYCVPGNTMYAPSMNEAFLRGRPHTYFTFDLIPSGNYIASAVFAQEMKGKKFDFRKKIGSKWCGYAYVFRGGGSVTAALFGLNAEPEELKLVFPELPENAVWKNIFGNPLNPVRGKYGYEIIFGSVPVYLTLKDEKELRKFLDKAMVRYVQEVKFYGARVVAGKEGKEGIGLFSDCQSESGESFEVGPGKNTSFPSGRVSVVYGHNLSFLPAVLSGKTAEVTVDGKPVAFYRNRAGRLPLSFRLPDGSSGSVRLSDGFLRLEVFVPCKSVKRIAGKGLWEADSIEIFLDGTPQENANDPFYRGNTYQLVFAPPAPGYPPEFSTKSARLKPDVDWSFKIEKAGYRFTMSLPLKQFRLNPALFGFDIIVNRRKDDGTVGSAVWSGTKMNYRDRLLFGLLSE